MDAQSHLKVWMRYERREFDFWQGFKVLKNITNHKGPLYRGLSFNKKFLHSDQHILKDIKQGQLFIHSKTSESSWTTKKEMARNHAKKDSDGIIICVEENINDLIIIDLTHPTINKFFKIDRYNEFEIILKSGEFDTIVEDVFVDTKDFYRDP